MPKSLRKQAKTMRKLFPELGECDFAQLEQQLPRGSEGYFAIPRWQKIAGTYSGAVRIVFDLLKKQRKVSLRGWNSVEEGDIRPSRITQSAKSKAAWKQIGDIQKNHNILVIPAQFGIRHAGRSIRNTRGVCDKNEFGLGVFAVGIMLITHPNRLAKLDNLWIECAGDEYLSQKYGGPSSDHAPSVFHYRDSLVFGYMGYLSNSDHYGSVTGWSLPALR